MADTLTATISVGASGSTSKDSVLCAAVDSVSSGSRTFPLMTQDIEYGTGAGQATTWYRAQRTLAAGAAESLDLSGSLLSPFGDTLTFTRVIGIVVAIVSADGTASVRVGPQGVANPWMGPWGTSADYIKVRYWWSMTDGSAAAWPVTAGTADILRISNPGAAAVDYIIWILGS